ncbi:site-specific integrase [Variovorax paradoxus]|nr:site-specific integrase [Variovorax paradoxus]
MSPYELLKPHFLTLEDVLEDRLNDEQRALFNKFKKLSSSTCRSYRSAFKGYLEGRPYVPANIHAQRVWITGVKWGCLLNTLHPDPDTAARWTQTLSDGISIPEVEFYDDLGCRYLRCVSGRQGRRRHRLPSIATDFVERMISQSAQSSREDLHFALMALALTGCRPCELASATFGVDENYLYLTLACAKEKFNETNSRPRTLVMERAGPMFGKYVDELASWAEGQTAPNPFAAIKAADMNNLCRRLSRKLWPRRQLVNPSCFRCVFIADLKNDCLHREHIAYQVGHQSQRSASRYGTSKQGISGRRGYLQCDLAEEREEPHSRPRG